MSHCYWKQQYLTVLATGADSCIPPAHRQDMVLSGTWADSFVRPQKPGHFGTEQSDERSWKHLPGLLGRVLEIVLGVGQDIKQCLDQFLILKYFLMVLRCIEPPISNYVFNEFLVILIVRHVWDLEPSGTVPFIGLKLNPQLLRSGGEGNGAFVGLAGFICRHRIG